MRGTQQTARLVAVAIVVLGALGLVTLAARSDRTPALAKRPAVEATTVLLPPVATRTQVEDGGSPNPGGAASEPTHVPSWQVWLAAALFVAPLVMGLIWGPAMLWIPGGLLPWLRRERAEDEPPEVDDEVEATALTAAVERGLVELDQGGPGEGVIASWVLLERAAADAGTHRAAPDTPSELAGRLIDRHGVSSGPLLRLAELYREARFSRHQLPESARTEAREALERLRGELEANPVGRR
ncbi:MAG TPA: DUF4129 domain-containing protein [Mycobacteriales bacterium]|jgi:hypothetical protein|nr:DUF4129 domain-containing protein [Mycobacteriales bacterium]